ncbi:hypothetical protein AGOR_G00112080 [Albula goreensis]|uniref:ZP domain-containing protein n=1 Tax=Albula goreensis TaxID=1534307 RepID=A0A8T3DFD1_9TELE|nr:hypothetical protein AGOR_G00112080 [Albula goreensis]
MGLLVVPVLVLVLGQALASEIQGGLMTFRPVAQHPDGTITVSFHYKESYRGQCGKRLGWSCGTGDCGQLSLAEFSDTDKDPSEHQLWCQAEGHILRDLSSDKPFTLRDTGCCWVSNADGATNWTLATRVDLGTRSDTHIFNKSPIVTTIPTIRIPQNCPTTFPLLVHDPDGDQVRCRFGQQDRGDCSSCHQHSNFTLHETQCVLQIHGTPGLGVHVFELVLEDYPAQPITLSYRDGSFTPRSPLNLSLSDSQLMPLSQLPLQFAVEIQSPLSTCIAGIVRPQLLSPTPSHGSILYASVGKPLTVTLRARAERSNIYDFQLSGPYNMTKVSFQNKSDGVAQVDVTWTPQESDVYRHVPVCFTAETPESQSEMRCVIVVVERDSPHSGRANISCMDTTMTIILEKNSMQGLEASQLLLKDPTCSLTTNGSHIMGTMSLNSCGTQTEDDGDYIVFKNEINSIKETGVITRQTMVQIPFSCSYPKVAHVSTNFKNHKSDYVFTETGFGSFSYSFEFYTDSTFQTVIDPNSYPVEVELLEKIHMGIQAHSYLPQVVLFVESCRATPDDNPDNALYYDIFKDGCSMDDTVNVSSGGKTEFKFEIQAFKFTGDFDKVYISCRVMLSTPQGAARSDEPHVIMQGPLIRRKSTLRSLGSEESSSGSERVNVSTLAFAGLFILTLVVLAGVMIFSVRKSRNLRGSHIHLLSSF